jgi:hypothetical protein
VIVVPSTIDAHGSYKLTKKESLISNKGLSTRATVIEMDAFYTSANEFDIATSVNGLALTDSHVLPTTNVRVLAQ